MAKKFQHWMIFKLLPDVTEDSKTAELDALVEQQYEDTKVQSTASQEATAVSRFKTFTEQNFDKLSCEVDGLSEKFILELATRLTKFKPRISMESLAKKLIILLHLVTCQLSQAQGHDSFTLVNNATSCASDNYTTTVAIPSDLPLCTVGRFCALMCSQPGEMRCQAFKYNSSHCTLVMFDKFNQSVNTVGCSRREDLYIARISGAEEGSVCPGGFNMSSGGQRYMMSGVASPNWNHAVSLCSSLGGLSYLTEVNSMVELQFLNNYLTKYYGWLATGMWVAGYQIAGSAEPRDGFVWSGSGTAISTTLFAAGEPNNVESAENWVVLKGPGLNDESFSTSADTRALCECPDPFA